MTSESSPRQVRVLVVDDDRLSRQTTLLQLRKVGFEADVADHAFRALELLSASDWDVVVSDLRMPGMDGLQLLARVRAEWPTVDVVLMTAFGTIQTAVAAMRAGAADYLIKPFRFEELEARLARITEVRACKVENRVLRSMLAGPGPVGGLVGACAEMRRVAERIGLFAEHDMPVLVTGETGTGKELVARALHMEGKRHNGPFIAVPCGAIPQELAESELFGHERGAFTSASSARPGAFERAHGGTLLLDDVDDLPLTLQAKLLRVLQDGSFARVGGSTERTTDVRTVATTKVELESAVATGRFRSDLMYRLRALEIDLPPLRARGEDVLLLATHFADTHAARAGRTRVALSPEVVRLIREYPWPGNVRELSHAVASALAMCTGERLEAAHLPDFVRCPPESKRRLYALDLENRETIPFAELIQGVEQDLIRWAMGRAAGQQTKAAEILGLARTTLQSKLGKGQ